MALDESALTELLDALKSGGDLGKVVELVGDERDERMAKRPVP